MMVVSVVGLAESVHGVADAHLLFAAAPGTALLVSFNALPLIVVPSLVLVSAVDMRAATLHDALLVTQPVNPVSVELAPPASVPKSAVGMFCVHPVTLPHEIVVATAAATPRVCVAVAARLDEPALSHNAAANSTQASATPIRNPREATRPVNGRPPGPGFGHPCHTAVCRRDRDRIIIELARRARTSTLFDPRPDCKPRTSGARPHGAASGRCSRSIRRAVRAAWAPVVG